MRWALRAGSFVACLYCYVLATANANDPSGNPPNAHEGMKQKILQQFDKNGDGKLDEAERQAARAAYQQKMHERADKNGDGKLGPVEKKHLQEMAEERRREHREELKEYFDKNHDGKLGPKEREAMHDAKKQADHHPDGKQQGEHHKPQHDHKPNPNKPPKVAQNHGQGPGAAKGQK